MIVFTLQDHKSGTVCEDYLAYFWFVCDNLKNYLKNKQKKKNQKQKTPWSSIPKGTIHGPNFWAGLQKTQMLYSLNCWYYHC